MKKKHILILLCVVSFVILIVQITYTYSLFETDRDAVIFSPIAKWNIMVNDSFITNDITENNCFRLGNIQWNSGGHVREGKAAPGSVGTFEINIDPTDTEVSFLYEITIDPTNFEDVDFYISNVRELNGKTFVRTGEFTYVGIASLEDIENDVVYHVEIDVSWENNDENNDKDYEIGNRATEEEINIPVHLKFVQYTGDEELIPYVLESEEP